MTHAKRRFLEWTQSTSATATLIAADSVFVGDLSGGGQFVVFGEVRGNGALRGSLHLSVTGRWQGDIQARRAIIAGAVAGNLTISEKLEIGRTAVIRGNVSARELAIAEGAVIDGDVEITSDAPIVRFEEKREPR